MKYNELLNELNVMLSNAMKEKKIDLFEGRPPRNIVINNDDIINLKIALYSSISFDDFIRTM